METFEQNKKCEVCTEKIPDSFTNLLCYGCYDKQVKEIQIKKEQEIEDKKGMPENIIPLPIIEAKEGIAKNGITDPNYTENPEMEDKEQVAANLNLFQKHGVLLWHPTRTIYEFIKVKAREMMSRHPQSLLNGGKHIWNPTIVDVGCGSGVGSNILSQEASFVWGIDKNEQSIKFAKEAFTRVKNNVYYSCQVSFDQWDIINDNKETMKFDIVSAIEVIEHIYDYKIFLEKIIKFDNNNPNNPTEYYISTPNRNNKSIQKDRPYNKYHCREWKSEELHAILSEYFSEIEFFSSAGEPAPIDTNHTPLLIRCCKLKK